MTLLLQCLAPIGFAIIVIAILIKANAGRTSGSRGKEKGMDFAVDYAVIECTQTSQHEIRHPFHTFSSAKAFADKAQAKADSRGNRNSATYHVIPKSSVVYSTKSRLSH